MATPIPLDDLPVIDRSCSELPPEQRFREGVIIPVDKPAGFTSFDIVKLVRNRIPVKKVGHAGTLDPLATGLLILCAGKATKSVSQLQDLPKIYLAEITFGASTPSYDSATEPDATAPWEHITEEMVRHELSENFTGTIDQIPPIFSALKQKGKRLYKLARSGVRVNVEPRPVEIYGVRILSVNLPHIRIEVTCGKGTYIRSLAHDLGTACGSLAWMSDLRRTHIGTFSVEDAWNPETFKIWSESNG